MPAVCCRPMRTLLVECALGLALAASWTPTASAQETKLLAVDPSEAEAHLAAGHAAYAAGNFITASDEFEAAYRISRDPEILRHVYAARLGEGEPLPAANALRNYLAEVPNPPDAVDLRARLDALDAQVAALAAEEARAAEPRTEEPVVLTPPPALPPRDETGRIASYAVTGAGIGLVLAATFIGFSALGTQSTLDDQCGPLRNMCPAGFAADRDRGQTLALVTDIVGITGALALGTGIAMLFLFQDDDAPPVQAGCGPDGCMIQARGSF